ncbi:sulfotransferase [Pontiella sp.]|uniref:sulfotransferase n=1 Tax=Pontiella sp. TaxID=2837462 RepID=UPI003563211E
MAKSTVPTETRLLSNLVFHARPFWAAMGNLESGILRDELDRIAIDRPIYVAGLARSGTTILLELLAAHERTASHTYRDFPMLYTPFWWNWFLKTASGGRPDRRPLEERTHKDGIQVGPESPEAMEEPLWMHYFSGLHDPARCNVLDARDRNRDFDRFYSNHIRKILLVRRAQRYLAKGNYNLSRIRYLARLFPDARFVVPVREPLMHIASLRKQQRLFEKLETEDPAVLTHMCRVGHFEFGLNRVPVNHGRHETSERIVALWNAGQDVEAWAWYWDDVHRHLLELLDDPQLKESILVVDYDALCSDSAAWVDAIFGHCRLEPDRRLVEEYAQKLNPPAYYQHGFSREEIRTIAGRTQETAEQLGIRLGA